MTPRGWRSVSVRITGSDEYFDWLARSQERNGKMPYLEQVLLPKVLAELKQLKGDPELIAEVRAALGTEAPPDEDNGAT